MAQTKLNGRQIATASIPLSSLVKSVSSQIIICDDTGTPMFSSISGDASIVVTTVYDGVTNSKTKSVDLVLTPSGVVEQTYGSNTQSIVFTVDSKGRIITANSVVITPTFDSITDKPTTLAGYGITDAVSVSESGFESPVLSIAASTINNQVMFVQRLAFT